MCKIFCFLEYQNTTASPGYREGNHDSEGVLSIWDLTASWIAKMQRPNNPRNNYLGHVFRVCWKENVFVVVICQPHQCQHLTMKPTPKTVWIRSLDAQQTMWNACRKIAKKFEAMNRVHNTMLASQLGEFALWRQWHREIHAKYVFHNILKDASRYFSTF